VRVTSELSELRETTLRELAEARNSQEVELTTKRNEFEQQLVVAGRNAEAAAKRMIDEATEQLADLNQRSEQVRREAGKIMADARKRAQETVQAAERQAANLLENANKQARERARELEARTLAEEQAAEQRLIAVRDERDQIEAYLEQMQELFSRMPLMSGKKGGANEAEQKPAAKADEAKPNASKPAAAKPGPKNG
jgi:hypothetical protein